MFSRKIIKKKKKRHGRVSNVITSLLSKLELIWRNFTVAQKCHGNFNFVHGNFNFTTAISTSFTAISISPRQFQLRSHVNEVEIAVNEVEIAVVKLKLP